MAAGREAALPQPGRGCAAASGSRVQGSVILKSANPEERSAAGCEAALLQPRCGRAAAGAAVGHPGLVPDLPAGLGRAAAGAAGRGRRHSLPARRPARHLVHAVRPDSALLRAF